MLEDLEEENIQVLSSEEDSDFSDVNEVEIENSGQCNSGTSDESGSETPVIETSESFYLGRDGVTQWKKNPLVSSGRIRRPNILTERPGPTDLAKNSRTEVEVLKLFLSEDLINLIVEFTNIKIRTCRENFSRERDARETDYTEMCAFLGVLYLAGTCQSNKQNILDLWRTDGMGVEIFRMVMGVNRFRFLLRTIRFDDVTDPQRMKRKSEDKLYCIRDMFQNFTSKCKSNYKHGASVTVDEMLPNFRGKCSFHVYMPSKPGKYGIKVWPCSDSNSYYTSNMEIFVRNQPQGPFSLDNSTVSTVQRMTSHIEGTGRNVTLDNYFTSISLAERLFEKNLTLVGTLRKNKREIPTSFISNNKERPCPSTIFGFTAKCTLVSFKPKPKKSRPSCFNNA